MRLANQAQLNAARYLQTSGLVSYEMITLMGCVLGRRTILYLGLG